MEQVATAIAKVPDPAGRAALAVKLFGKSGTEVLPALLADFKSLGDAAPVMSDKTVRALDDAGDKLALFGDRLKVAAAEAYNFAGKAFDTLSESGFRLVASLLNMTAGILEMAQKIPGASKAMELLGVNTKGLRDQAQWYRHDRRDAQITKVDVEVRKAAPALIDLSTAHDDAAKNAKSSTGIRQKHRGGPQTRSGLFRADDAVRCR